MKKEQKETCMKENLDFLNKWGIEYEAFNNGYHLKIKTFAGVVDFWPSTNKWMFAKKVRYGSVEDMLKFLNKVARGE